MDTEKQSLNKEAQYTRHKKIFSDALFFGGRVIRFLSDLKSFMKILPRILFRRRASVSLPIAFIPPPMHRNTLSRFFKQSLATGIALLIVTSIAPTTLLETGLSADFFIDSETLPDEFIYEDVNFFTTDDGFVLKTNPSIGENGAINRLGFTDNVKYTVLPGDTLSEIADRYSISVATVEWANGITSSDALQIGQTLVIPPLDGVEHVSKKGETLSKIAKLYNVDVNVIIEHNRLESEVITPGKKLFVPGGKRQEPVIALRTTPSRAGRSNYNAFELRDPVQSSNAKPIGEKRFIYPTSGRITQGFRNGHYAVDIANKPTDIWAAAGGTVVKVSGGCPPREGPRNTWQLKCNSGYGNYIIIDHGDGWKSLYAHMDAIYIEKGQEVTQGQAVGRMGSSGRVYGATGVHLHFECIVDGVKVNPTRCY